MEFKSKKIVIVIFGYKNRNKYSKKDNVFYYKKNIEL